MINSIDLSRYDFIFNHDKIYDLRKTNFIFGKNGTGKSTITDAILKQYGDEYDVKLFNGPENVIKDKEELDSIILGKKNVDIDTEVDRIKAINKQYVIQKKELNEKIKNFESSIEKEENRINSYCSESARILTDEFNLGRNYDRRNFKNDIINAKKLDNNKINYYNKVYKSERKDISNIKANEFVFLDISKFELEIQALINKRMNPSIVIQEFEDTKKEKFARLGMTIHDRNEGEKCAFCGNKIDSSRWKDLDKYFDDTLKVFKSDINEMIKFIESKIDEIKKVDKLDENLFYPVVEENLIKHNENIISYKKDYENYLLKNKELLKIKSDEIFNNNIIDELNKKYKEIVVDDYSKIIIEENELLSKNKEYHQQIDNNKKDAKEKLRLNKVSQLLDEFDYINKDKYIGEIKIKIDEVEKKINDIKNKIEYNKLEISNLIGQSISEEKCVDLINKDLLTLPNITFKLTNYSINMEEKGTYRIFDTNNEEFRSIQTLSKGEKNLISFLWFMNSIDEVNTTDEREKIVVIDDPMDSNDDYIQYLMMGKIISFYRYSEHQFILLTHNTHFYIQVIPTRKKFDYKNDSGEVKLSKFRFLRLKKNTGKTEIEFVNSDKDNIKSLYVSLWQDLREAYDLKKPNFMWNIMRRILETFLNFIGKYNSIAILTDILEIYDKPLALGLIKGLHINSHIGKIEEIDISSHTRDDLIKVFKFIFNEMNHEEHFNKYWGKNEF